MEKVFKNFINVAGHLTRDAIARTNSKDNTQFWSCRLAVNGKPNEEPKFYSFTVSSERLAKYMVQGKYVSVCGDLVTTSKDGYINSNITKANVILLNQVKREEVAQTVTEPEEEFVPADDGVPF